MLTFQLRAVEIARTYDVTGAPPIRSEVTRWSIQPDTVTVRLACGTWSVDVTGRAVNPDGVVEFRATEDFHGDSIPDWVQPLLTEGGA